MSRPPYPARVVAGLVAATVEETRKLPTRVITFPMSAVSMGLQAGMRLQQNIAELAIKGDELLAPLCDKAEEQPEWARFDEDDAPVAEPVPLRADAPRTIPDPPEPATPAAGGSTTAKATADPAAAGADAASAKAPTAKAETNGTSPNGSAAAGGGRFALYSSAPADVAEGATTSKPAADAGEPLPATVAALDYPNLTLAQLRAKVRSLSADELAELLAFEKGGRNRTPFVTMIDNRLTSQQKKPESTP